MPAQTVARIKRARIPKDTVTMARWLLGKVLVHKFRNRLMTARIVETEAYLRISTSGPWSSTSTIAIIS